MSERSAGTNGPCRPKAGGMAGTASPRSKQASRLQQFGTTPRLDQRVVEILSGQIESGQLLPETRLQESSVAAMFGISRAPVRQALAALEQQGFIEKAVRRGYRVRAVKRSSRMLVADSAGANLRLVSASRSERIYSEVESEIVARIAFGGVACQRN